MSKSAGKVPEIRFKGFEGEWEKKKLGEVFIEYSEKNHTELPALTIIQGGGTIKRSESDRNITFDEKSLGNYKLVHKDDFIMHLRSFEGGLEKATCDGIISPAYHTFHGEQADSRFYYPYFRSSEFIERKLPPFIYGIRDGKSIDIDGMKTINIPFPAIEEQEKIGDYIGSLDTAITLHERKCEETKELKKYMLQKMFPKEGEKVPEIRFPGFEGEWEEKKLGDVVKFYNGLTYTPDDVQDNGTLVLRSSNVKNGELINADDVYVNSAIVNSQNVQKGDVIVVVRNGSRALIGKHALIHQDMPDTVIGAFMTGIRSEHAYFINALLDTPQFAKEIRMNMGATINQITGYMFSSMSFRMPSNKEQTIIGNYFVALDTAITYHERKCEEARELKKYMLQNMFPKEG